MDSSQTEKPNQPTYAEIKERRAKRERLHECAYGHNKFICKPSRLCRGCADGE